MEVKRMKNIRLLLSVLLLPIVAALLFSCLEGIGDETAPDSNDRTTAAPSVTYFTANISHNDEFVPGDILIISNDPNADYTAEDFSEIDCESIRLGSRYEDSSYWVIKIKTKTKAATIEAIKKLTYRSDLTIAEPNYLFSAD